MSRKTLMLVIGLILAVVSVIQAAAGTSQALPATITGLGAILVYIFFEAKADIQRVKEQILQSGRYKDPKFLTALVTAIITALSQAGVNLPINPEVIIGFLTALIAVLFKVQPAVPTE